MRFIFRLKGGPGSGHVGHAGRPGSVGGSLPGKGGVTGVIGPKDAIKGVRTLNSPDYETAWKTSAVYKEYESWASGISDEDRETFRLYTSTEFSERVNNHLRGIKRVDGQDATIRDLDAAIARAPALKEETLVYRAATNTLANVKPGDTFTDRGFGSTTVNEDLADWWPDTDVKMIVLLPKGTKGAYVAALTLRHYGESEYLLPRNSKYEVIGNVPDAMFGTATVVKYLGVEE